MHERSCRALRLLPDRECLVGTLHRQILHSKHHSLKPSPRLAADIGQSQAPRSLQQVSKEQRLRTCRLCNARYCKPAGSQAVSTISLHRRIMPDACVAMDAAVASTCFLLYTTEQLHCARLLGFLSSDRSACPLHCLCKCGWSVRAPKP